MVRIDKRFGERTRGRTVTLLRQESHAVSELAGELNLTDNAVRAPTSNGTAWYGRAGPAAGPASRRSCTTFPPKGNNSSQRPTGPSSATEERIEGATGVLRDLGGCCEAEVASGTVILRCVDCPLAAAVNGHPEVCKALEAVLTDVLAVPVRQRCEESPPRCRFEFEPRPRRRG